MNRYFFLLAGCILLTLPLEVVLKARVYARFLIALKAISLPAMLYLIWDIFATHFDHWSFSKQHASDIRIFSLPIEEYAFFLVVPICALLTYEAVGNLKPSLDKERATLNEWMFFVIGFSILGFGTFLWRISSLELLIPERIFPFYTLATTAICSILLIWILKNETRRTIVGSQRYFLTLLICLFFMIPMNGLLTILSDPVVSYSANFGPRMFLDIPMEDFFYGSALIAWVIIRWEKYLGSEIQHSSDKINS